MDRLYTRIARYLNLANTQLISLYLFLQNDLVLILIMNPKDHFQLEQKIIGGTFSPSATLMATALSVGLVQF